MPSAGRLHQLRAVGVDLPDRLDDVIQVAAIGEQHALAHGQGRLADLLVALQFTEAVAIRLQALGAPKPLEPARGDGLVEQSVVIFLVIHAAARDADTALAKPSRDSALNCWAS